MKIFLAQIKPYLGNVSKNLELMIEVIKKQIEEKNEVVIFPELSLTGYLLEEMVYDVAISKVPDELLELSKDISIVFGAVELGKDYYYYNSAFYLEDGEVKHIHRKIYLPTYGLFDEGRYFKEGNRIRAFETKYGKVGMLICEDVFHLTSSYILSEDGANIVYVLANSPLRMSDKGLEIKNIWESIGKASVVSNTNFWIVSNRVGVEDGVTFWGGSFAINPTGEIIKKLKVLEEDGATVSIEFKELSKARATGSGKNVKLDLVLNELNRIKQNR